METENIKEKLEDITSHATDLAETYVKLAVATATQKTANVAASAGSGIMACILAVFGILFAGFGLGWWLGDLVSSRAGGFLIVGGFFLVMGVVVIGMSKKIIYPWIRNSIVRKFYE